MSKVVKVVPRMAPNSVPPHVAVAAFGINDSIELKVAVSEKSSIKAYGFAFGGAPVIMKGGQGTFFATKNQTTLLEWVMIGDPGGTMKVTVTRDGAAIQQRDASEIAPPFTKGYDAFEILVQ